MTEPAPGSVLADRYAIERELGRGAMGIVFAARDTRTGRSVAIKWLHSAKATSPEAVLRFLAEAQATARIEHPNVVAVLDASREGQNPFLVMEHLRGETLGARLERGPLPVAEALDVIIAACRGVAEAHREGVIHRDLKPDNIFLAEGKDGVRRDPKVLDFGVARLFSEEQRRTVTETGAIVGTPSYMPPEQFGAQIEPDARFDVYSMGVVLYHALTGQLPFRADTIYALVHQIGQRPAPIRACNPEVSPELEEIVLCAMSADRERRWPTMHALIAALESARPRPIVASAPKKERSSLALGLALVAGFLALCVLGGAAGGVLLWMRTSADHGGAIAVRDEPTLARDDETPPGPPSDPLRPDVALTLAGACEGIRFDGDTIRVTTAPGTTLRMIAITSIENDALTGSLVVQGEGPLDRPVVLNGAVLEALTQISAGGTNSWHSAVPGTSGTIHFHAWAPDSGIVDATYDQVVLRHLSGSGTTCTVNGRVTTRGLTMGL
jgi:hypothetical protein